MAKWVGNVCDVFRCPAFVCSARLGFIFFLYFLYFFGVAAWLVLDLEATQIQLQFFENICRCEWVSKCALWGSTVMGAVCVKGLGLGQLPCCRILMPWWNLFALISAYFWCVRVRCRPTITQWNNCLFKYIYTIYNTLCLCVFQNICGFRVFVVLARNSIQWPGQIESCGNMLP